MSKALFQIEQLDCAGCAKQIKDRLKDQKGILSVKVFPKLGKIRTLFDETKVNAEQLTEILANLGFQVQSKK